MTDRSRRLLALSLFAGIVALDVANVALRHGLHGQPPLQEDTRVDVVETLGIVVYAIAGLVLTWARPRNPIGWLVSLAPLFLVLCDAGQGYGARAAVFPDEHLPLGRPIMALAAPLWMPALFLPVTALLVRYPTGQLRTRWGRRFDRCVWIGLPPFCLVYALSPSAVTDVIRGGEGLLPAPPAWVAAAFGLPLVALCLTGLFGILGEAVFRLVRGVRAERMALLWLLAFGAIGVSAVWFSPWEGVGTVFYNGIPVAIAIGVMRYGAVGIEVVVRRTLVYAIMTGLVLAVFVAVVAGLTRILPSGGTPQLVAAALVAVGLGPARDRIQAGVDRLIYGERRDPIAALRRLGRPVGAEEGPGGELVAGVLAALAVALKVESVTLAEDGGVPLSFAGQDLGSLVVRPRRGETTLTSTDQRLVEAVAPMIAAVVHADRLNEQLIVERSRVVAAATAERARLRQELHDGLGPSLTGIGLGLEAAERRAEPALIARLRTETSRALEEVRRIIDDLRPTALDDADLVTALRRRTDQLTATGAVSVDFDAPAEAMDLPEQVAAAAYRIADEALTNVVRHSQAAHCRLTLSLNGALEIEIADDGIGPGQPRSGGVGLTSMVARAERLGGRLDIGQAHPGTRVTVLLPLGEP